jgi:uncharacterized membrane protein
LKPAFIFAFIGILIALLGNYFQSIRPNYFIGIRTPWTLENETVWKKTHRLGGRLWFGGGLIIIILTLILGNNKAIAITFTSIIAILVIVPIVYSYFEFLKQKSN